MSLFDIVKSILGIKPVKVGDIRSSISTSPNSSALLRLRAANERIEDIEVIPEYKKICALINAGVPLVFVTGGAGTGKSTLIQFLRNTLNFQIAVVAPTGIAALNVHGVTIHSFFHFPPRIIEPEDIKKVYDRKLYNKLDILIVDEVSMVRSDLLDGMDSFLKINRNNNAPFGGVKVLLIGDLFQLPPVVSEDEHLVLRHMNYESEFFFGSLSITGYPFVPVFLNKIFRQCDPVFTSLLNDIRESKNLINALRIINKRNIGPDRGYDNELVLTCTNSSADKRNKQELTKLKSSSKTYFADIKGKFPIEKTRLPSPFNLVLKKGAQVMFTKNDDNKRWVNGTLGKVVDLGTHTVKVEIKSRQLSEHVLVEPVTWEKYKYEYDLKKDRIVANVIGEYTQLPLVLAWAVTIHKAQGKTLDRIFIDFGNRAFAPGQVYVALSRVRSLEDIRLSRPIRKEEVRCDFEVKNFYEQLKILTRID
jgi:tRNA A37 threonylcarbamoyladenosine biosynthesis protein TsaE